MSIYLIIFIIILVHILCIINTINITSNKIDYNKIDFNKIDEKEYLITKKIEEKEEKQEIIKPRILSLENNDDIFISVIENDSEDEWMNL